MLPQDNEAYRATVRTQIREWLDSVTAKYHQEWLIVHVTSGKGSGAKFYQRKSAIVDKIKADFNVGKKDRQVLLRPLLCGVPADPSSALTAAYKSCKAHQRTILRHGPSSSPRSRRG